ncbi:hypothetical protein Adt_03683 [Abeliophyllum distichum]|uniref:Retrotransposon gag domain-containing protein n=1 Tax=Abeliophyllum distichum TaxID=126358 RepID=A0ABD1W2I1_9LAMI
MSAFVGQTLGEALTTRLNDIRHELNESVKSYFNRFQNVLIAVASISDEKALDALWIGLRMETIYVRNKRTRTYYELVDIIKAEIQEEETIEKHRTQRYRSYIFIPLT